MPKEYKNHTGILTNVHGRTQSDAAKGWLIGNAGSEEGLESRVRYEEVNVDDITPRLINKYSQSRIERLARSIRSTNNRLIHPIVLVKPEDLPENSPLLKKIKESGVLEDPILSDMKEMIQMSYDNGTIDEAIRFMNEKYDYYIVKNMHQLFLQITKEGAQNSADSLENMQQDIDMLVESVYRDRIERASFHKSFLQFGIMLYLMVMLVQYLVGNETYLVLLERWYIQVLMHGVLIINTYFLLKGEKYYNENVGAE